MFQSPEFWVAVGFVILVVAGFKKGRDAICGLLDQRADRIRAQLDEARKLREDAQHLLADYQRRQNSAAEEAKAIVAQAKVEAERIRTQAEADLAQALKRREQQALEKISQAESVALREVREQAVDLAVAATTRLMAAKVDAAARRPADRRRHQGNPRKTALRTIDA